MFGSASGRCLLVVLGVIAALSCSGDTTGPAGGTVAKVSVQPSLDSLQVSGTVTLQATAHGGDGAVISGRQVFWNSENNQIATVSSQGVVTAIAPGSVRVAASVDGVSGLATIVVVPKSVASVEVTPATPSIRVGETVHLQATTRAADGEVLTGRTVTWSSANTGVATVDASGVVTGVSPGAAQITATSEGKSGSTIVTVTARVPASITITPPADTIVVGQSTIFTATVKDSSGAVLTNTVAWTSSNPTVAPIDASGLVQGVATGTATITAKSGNVSKTASVLVNPVPANAVTVSPSSATLTVGDTLRFSATVTDAKGNVLTGRTITWSSSNTAVATVDANGLVHAIVSGSATISAMNGGKTGTASLTVNPVPVASVVVSPDAATVHPGATVQLSATPEDANGNPLTGRTVTWSSNNTAVATVSSTGLVTAVTVGTAVISATVEGHVGTSTFTVTPVPVGSVSVAPANDTIVVGAKVTFTATVKDSLGSVLTGRVVQWSSSDPTVATIDASTGVATGVGAGTATITATCEGVSGQVTLTVILAPVASVAVTPQNDTIFVDSTVTFSATLRDTQGNVLTGRAVSWSSSNTAVATIDPTTGVAKGVATGSVTITATSEGVSGTAPLVVVVVPVKSVVVAPPTASVTAVDSVQLSDTAKDANGNVLTGRATTWSSSDTTVATVSATGLVKGVSVGTVTITATVDGVNGTAAITVTAAPVSSVTVTPADTTIDVSAKVQYAALTADALGRPLTGRKVTWSSSAPTIASIDKSGLATGKAAGSAVITATSEMVSGTANITVVKTP